MIGSRTATEMVHCWVDLLPKNIVIVTDCDLGAISWPNLRLLVITPSLCK